MKKVVYINYQSITSRYYNDYYIDKCIENGLEVEYWDVSGWIFPNVEFNSDIDFPDVKFIRSNADLKLILSRIDIKSTFIVVNITYEFRVIKLFFTLSAYNCCRAFFARGMYPMPSPKVASELKKILLSFNFRRVKNVLQNRFAILLKRINIVKPYNYIFQAGSEGGKTIGGGSVYDITTAQIKYVNYFDFDKFLEVNKENYIIKEDYCVFIDQYLAYHPDIEMFGLKNVNADKYFLELNSFFAFIESKFHLNVIIAAHPKADKYLDNNPFSGRLIIFGKTCELVKDAKFVLTHHSTAISFSILFEKPIIFLNSELLRIAMPDLYELTIFWSEYLNSEIAQIDNFDINQEFYLKVDYLKYVNYKYNYLTSIESENKYSSQIFIETILAS